MNIVSLVLGLVLAWAIITLVFPKSEKRGGYHCEHGETEWIGGVEYCAWCGK